MVYSNPVFLVSFSDILLNRGLGTMSHSDAAKLIRTAFVIFYQWISALPRYLDTVF
jgi:hypothetical protein